MFIPDWCVLGSEDGKIHVWNAESGMKVALLDGKHTGPITCLQFNPKFMTFASACSNMVSLGRESRLKFNEDISFMHQEKGLTDELLKIGSKYRH